MTIGEWLAKAKAVVASLDAELIAADSFGVNRAKVLAHPEWAADPSRLDPTLDRRAKGEPMAYIRGKQEFFGREFVVSRDVLIPRPETEILVEAVLSESVNGRVVDVGTGSGAIAVTLALENAKLEVAAVDISAPALRIAQLNATSLSARIAFVRGDCLGPVVQGWDAIVSNPPYIVPEDPRLEPSVADWEPPAALYAEHGTAFIETLLQQAARVLKPGGLVAFEFGLGQEPIVREFLASWEQVRVLPDLAGIPRVAVARRSCGN